MTAPVSAGLIPTGEGDAPLTVDRLALIQAAAAHARAAALREYADRHHHFGEAYTTVTDYGTGVEHGASCACGAEWYNHDDGIEGGDERHQLLTDAAAIEAGTLSEPAS